MTLTQVRPAGLAGQFYPGDKLKLSAKLSFLFENAAVHTPPRKIRSIIAPHSGLSLAGGVAARSYRQLMNSAYSAIIVLAPSLEESFEYCAIYPGTALSTPLGAIAVNSTLTRQLNLQHEIFQFSEQGYTALESSLETQLPFIKWVWNSTPIVPLMIGNQSIAMIDVLVSELVGLLQGKDFLIIASSDMSSNLSADASRERDKRTGDLISKFDTAGLSMALENGQIDMTGPAAVISALEIAHAFNARSSEVLLYRNTADVENVSDGVVGYLSAIVY